MSNFVWDDVVRARRAFVQKAFTQHMNQLRTDGVVLRCPVCQNPTFTIQDTETATPFDETLDFTSDPWGDKAMKALQAPVVARVILTCRRCFHLVEFAWNPIRSKATP